MLHKPFTLLIHIALAIILAGAIVTHFLGVQGQLSLTEDSGPASEFEKTSGPSDARLPFSVTLLSADIDFYPGTTTPMDFRSHLLIDSKPVTVSMNNVAEIDGWRFYQSGISPGATRLSVSHDPWGTGITYTGYALLFIGMAGFFFQRNTLWRAVLRQGRRAVAAVGIMSAFGAGAQAQAQTQTPLPAMQRPLAADMGKAYVYWNDRVCPLQTMARDITRKLYGSDSYRGMTAEQVLSGWLFYFDSWERDFYDTHTPTPTTPRQQKARHEREALIRWLGTGEAFRIYPYIAADGHTEWLSLTGRRPSCMSLEQWTFMQTTMPRIKQLLLEGRNIQADKTITALIEKQTKYAGRKNLPSTCRMEAERIYNRYGNLPVSAVLTTLLGVFCLFAGIKKPMLKRGIMSAANICIILVTIYLAAMIALIWWTGGHIPLSNGPELMLFMSLGALIFAAVTGTMMLKGAFLAVASMTLLVGVMGGSSPRIGMLMPVLASPLLSIHVMLVMTSYVLFLVMSVLAAIGLSTKSKTAKGSIFRINRLILVPAVFLLAGGIFIGAVWANQSWGRYWGWDPKETCALIMLIVYSVPLHSAPRLCRALRKPRVFHCYLLLAVLTVLFTYFGANYFLSGLHSYA